MAYRNPEYGFLHAAADAGVAAISSPHGFESDFPAAHLIDRRPSSLAIFGSAESDHTITLDRGAGTLDLVNRLVIPAGHNLDGAGNLQVHSSPDGTFGGEETLIGFLSSPALGLIDMALADSSARHLRLSISNTGAWELPALWYTERRAMDEAAPDPRWGEPIRVPAERRATPTRTASSILGAPRRGYRFRYVGVSGDDQALLDDLREYTATGMRAFWLWPPDDGDGPVLVESAPRGQGAPDWLRDQDHRGVAAFGASYTWELELLEVTA